MSCRLCKRFKTLWYLSGLSLEKETSIIHKIKEGLGINQAIIVETEDPIDKIIKELAK